jgi:hypothetical protein
MDARNINVLIGEYEISYFIINGSGTYFMDNIYNHGIPMFNS